MSPDLSLQEINRTYGQIYSEMYLRNTNLISLGHIVPDPLISPQLTDTRKGIGIFAFGEYVLNTDFELLSGEASSLFADNVLYSPGSSTVNEPKAVLHFTFFQIHKVAQTLDQFDPELYHDTISEVVSGLPKFSIKFGGIIGVPSGLLMYGTPSIDINKFRNLLRTGLDRNNLNYVEPYKSNTAHSTLLRFTHPVDKNQLIQFVDKWHNVPLGEMKLSRLSLGFGSWKMLAEEVKILHDYKLS